MGRNVHLHAKVDLGHVDEALAQGPRHRRVDLGDDHPRPPDGRLHALDGGPQRAEPVLVRGRDVAQHGVEGEQVGIEEMGHVREEDRHVLGATFVDRLAGVGADEQRRCRKWPAISGARCGPGPFDMQVDDADVRKLRRACHEGVEQNAGHSRGALDIDLVAGPDTRNGLGGADHPHPDCLHRLVHGVHGARPTVGRDAGVSSKSRRSQGPLGGPTGPPEPANGPEGGRGRREAAGGGGGWRGGEGGRGAGSACTGCPIRPMDASAVRPAQSAHDGHPGSVPNADGAPGCRRGHHPGRLPEAGPALPPGRGGRPGGGAPDGRAQRGPRPAAGSGPPRRL